MDETLTDLEQYISNLKYYSETNFATILKTDYVNYEYKLSDLNKELNNIFLCESKLIYLKKIRVNGNS